MSIVNTTLKNGSDSCFLLILDASTMQEIARTTIGAFNAFLLHSSFVNKDGKAIAVN
jgi:torulene dioxygenase